jgi:hypothetical protein
MKIDETELEIRHFIYKLMYLYLYAMIGIITYPDILKLLKVLLVMIPCVIVTVWQESKLRNYE